MKLPNAERSEVDIRKLTEYCLNTQHPRGRHKARVFASFGITHKDAEELRTALLGAATSVEAQPGAATPHGQRYLLDFDLTRLDRVIKIRGTWIVRADEDFPRLTSCYVL